ncbi:MAG: hypothetical protein KAR19_12620 [Bacteroidales bacterium]|nr:hypothetical protein [Bacteroidales bacterium]
MFPAYDDQDKQRMQTLFNTMKDVEVAPQVRDVGPFSSLFNYEQEKARQDESYAKREEVNQKIARGNSIVDAFRLITQGLTGSAGATIPKEAPNQSVIRALNDFMVLDSEKKEALDRFRMLGLNASARDLQYKHGLEAEGRQREFTGEQAELGRTFQAGEAEKGREFKAGEMDISREFSATEAAKRDKARADQIHLTQKGQRNLEKYRADQGHYSYQDRAYSNRKSYDLKGVSITPDLQTKMIRALQMMYEGDPMKPRALKDIDRNENVQDESIRDLFLGNWDELKKLVPELSTATGVTPGQSTAQPQQQQKRNPAEGDSVLLEKKLKDAASRFSKEGKPRKQIKDNKRPGVSLEKQAKQNDRIGIMMRAFKEFDPDITWEEAYNDAMEFLYGHYQKRQSFNASGQGTINQSMAYYPPQ